jgi:hypothetical protein
MRDLKSMLSMRRQPNQVLPWLTTPEKYYEGCDKDKEGDRRKESDAEWTMTCGER